MNPHEIAILRRRGVGYFPSYLTPQSGDVINVFVPESPEFEGYPTLGGAVRLRVRVFELVSGTQAEVEFLTGPRQGERAVITYRKARWAH